MSSRETNEGPGEGAIGYEAATRLVRSLLVEAQANARAFATRARGRPELLSELSWGELAGIETLLAGRVHQTLLRELRVDPAPGFTPLRVLWRGVRDGLSGERALLLRLFASARDLPVAQWRAGAPQLETSLWAFFEPRTRYLANTLALALGEPAPHPPLIWHPGRREFQHR